MKVVPFKGREVYEGMRVQVYLNLHKVEDDGTKWYSLRDKRTGKVIGHANNVHLKDARFIVNERGRERVRQEQRKNVHAWVEGELADCVLTACRTIRYNPYRDKHFNHNGEPVFTAHTCVLESSGKVRA